jgi:hypothetical protein
VDFQEDRLQDVLSESAVADPVEDQVIDAVAVRLIKPLECRRVSSLRGSDQLAFPGARICLFEFHKQQEHLLNTSTTSYSTKKKPEARSFLFTYLWNPVNPVNPVHKLASDFWLLLFKVVKEM